MNSVSCQLSRQVTTKNRNSTTKQTSTHAHFGRTPNQRAVHTQIRTSIIFRRSAKSTKKRRNVSTYRLRQVAGAFWGVEDFVVENGEVEGEAQADGVRRGEVLVGQLRG